MDGNNNIKIHSQKSVQACTAAEETITKTMKICIKMAAASIPLVILTTYSCIKIVFTVCYIARYTISKRFGSLGTQNSCKGKSPFMMPCRTLQILRDQRTPKSRCLCTRCCSSAHLLFQQTTINMHVINLMAHLMMPFNCEKMITVMRKRLPLPACHKKAMHKWDNFGQSTLIG